MSVKVVSCLEKYELFQFCFDDDGNIEYTLVPIVAWLIETDVNSHGEVFAITSPITIEGTHREGYPIVYPDGSCRITYEATFENTSLLKKYLKERNL